MGLSSKREKEKERELGSVWSGSFVRVRVMDELWERERGWKLIFIFCSYQNLTKKERRDYMFKFVFFLLLLFFYCVLNGENNEVGYRS